MIKVTQRNNTLGKEKSQLDAKIEALSNEKQKLVVKSLFLFHKHGDVHHTFFTSNFGTYSLLLKFITYM